MDTKEFAKMFKLNIPVEEHFNYYMVTLSKSPEFSDITDLVNEFADFEKWVKDHGYGHIGSYKKKVLLDLKKKIQDSKAFERFSEFDYSSFVFATIDKRFEKSDRFFLSIDIKSANFSTMKTFDEEDGLGANWEEFCNQNLVHPTLAKSKSFRQVVFGNINSKRNGKIQLSKMNQLSDILEDKGYDLAYISNDEVIITSDQPYEDLMPVNEIITQASQDLGVPLKLSLIKWDKLDGMRKGEYLKRHYNYYVQHQYNSLVGVPGNIYYKYFKRYVLEEDYEERDLYFINEGRLAKWVI